MCGAVTISARAPTPRLRVCHCDMCRQQTSSMFMSLDTEQEGMTVSGPAQVYRSSEWAERGFCGTCGSTLWYGTVEDGARHLSAGLFEDAAGATLTLEFFADNCPQGYRMAGDHQRLSAEETVAMFSGDDA